MSIFFAILLIIASAMFFVWSFNISFGSHVVEERKKFWVYYLFTHVLTLVAITAAIFASILLR